jgi:arginine N-succinyltransferase
MTSPTSATATWHARPATAADADALAALRDLHGAPLPPLAESETAWVASAEAGAPPVATLRLRRHIGRPVPRGWFRLGWAVHASAELGLYRRQRTLLLGHDLTGADELCGFGCATTLPAAEAGPAWAVLVQAAMQARQAAPAGTASAPCIAELPGLSDAEGSAPVWQALGQHFHGQDLATLRRQLGSEGLHHLAALMPRHLVYASLLPAAAQAAFGQVHAAALPLQAALLQTGFGAREHITVTDGGPVLECWPAALTPLA